MGFITKAPRRLASVVARVLALLVLPVLMAASAGASADLTVRSAFVAEFPGISIGSGCSTCHKDSSGPASGWNRAFFQDVNAQDGLAMSSLATYAAQIDTVASQYAPKFDPATGNVTVSKVAGASRTVPVSLILGTIGLNSATKPTDNSPKVKFSGTVPAGVGLSGSGSAWSIDLPASLANRFGTLDVTLRAQSSELLFCKSPAGCDGKTFTITLGNSPPVLNASVFNIVVGNAAVTSSVAIAADADGDSLTATVTVPPTKGTVVVNPNLTITYDPTDGFTTPFSDEFQVQVADGGGGVATGTIKISTAGVNSPPKPVSETLPADEDTTKTGTAHATDDNPLDVLTFTAGACTANGTLSFTNAATGAFSYDPFPDFNGTDKCAFTVFDGTVSAGAILTFNVAPKIDPPTVANLPDLTYSVAAGASDLKSINLQAAVTVKPGETAPAGLTYTIVSVTDSDPAGVNADIPNPAVLGTFSPAVTPGSVIPQGTLTYSNLRDVPLDFTIRFKVSDPGLPATAGCGPGECGTLHISYTVDGNGRHTEADRNALAKSLGDRYKNVPQGSGFHFPQTEAQGACSNCHVPGKERVLAPNCSGTAFFNAFGRRLCAIRPFKKDPDGTFTSRLNDAIKQLPSFEPTIVSAQASVLVQESQTGDIGSLIEFSAGLDLVNGAAADVVAAEISEPAARDILDVAIVDRTHGQLRLKSGKSFGAFTASDVLNVTVLPVNNGSPLTPGGIKGKLGFYPTLGTNVPAPIKISITRELPVAVDDQAQVSTTAANVSIPVLDNDTPKDFVTGARIVGQPLKGSVSVSGRNIVFVPPKNIAAQEDITFTYKALRALPGRVLESDRAATVTVTVFPAGIAVAQDDGPVLATIGQVLTIDVLANDQGATATAGLNILTAQPMAHGTAVVATRKIEYTPKSVGTDILQYQLTSAGSAITTTAKVTITVTNISGNALAAQTNNPELKPVAFALGDSCNKILGKSAPGTADQADLVAVCNALITAAGIDGSLDSIRNEEVLAAGDAAMQHDRNTQGNILGRLDAARGGGGRGLTFSQFALQIDGQSLPGAMLDNAIQGMGVDGTILGGANNPWGMFVAGTLALASQDSSDREAGFDLNGADFTAGIDYSLDEKTLLGLAASYGRSGLDYSSGGALDTESIQIALYGAMALSEGLTIDGYGGYALTNYDLSRIVSVPGMGTRTAKGDFGGEQFSAALRLKNVQTLGGIDVETYGMLNYLAVWNDAYTESGAGGLSLAVGKQDFDTLAGTLGVKFSRPFDTEAAVITPYVAGSYSYQLLSDARAVTSQFQAAAGLGATGFAVRSDGDGRNLGSVEIGLSAENEDQTKASASLSGTMSDGGFKSLAIRAGLTIPFNARKPEPVVAPDPVRRPPPAAVPPPAAKKPTNPDESSADTGGSQGGSPGGSQGGGWSN